MTEMQMPTYEREHPETAGCTKPLNASVRREMGQLVQWMGLRREIAERQGDPSVLRDAKRWHTLARQGGVGSFPAGECEAWAVLYRAAYYGRATA